MKESVLVKFLYRTAIGRLFLKLLVNPKVSRFCAHYFSSSFSKWLIPVFINKNNINIENFVVPDGGYKSFNDFFTRKMIREYNLEESATLVSPCDGLLTVSEINEDSVFYIKHTQYGLKELLKDGELAKEFIGGTAYIFRLTPAHYHRYIWPSSGQMIFRKRIDGILHSVQPVCHENANVFVENSREYAVIDTSSIGKVIQMEIGALLVGKISNHHVSDCSVVNMGEEKGFFEYGGSSIVVLTKEKSDLPEAIKNRVSSGCEIPVKIGETLI